jgi:hypothetical protein
VPGFGLVLFGRAAWSKYRGGTASDQDSGEERANVLSPRVCSFVLVGALVVPVYFLMSSSALRTGLFGAHLGFLAVVVLMWVIGVVLVGTGVYIWRVLAPHFKRGFDEGRR